MEQAGAWLFGDESGSGSRNGDGGGGGAVGRGGTRGACSNVVGQRAAIAISRRAVQTRTGAAGFVIRTAAEVTAAGVRTPSCATCVIDVSEPLLS